MELVKKIEELPFNTGVSPSQYVLAWLSGQGDDFFVIPGTKKIKYLEQNMKAGELKLTKEEEAEMRAAINAAQPQGARYIPILMSYLDG